MAFKKDNADTTGAGGLSIQQQMLALQPQLRAYAMDLSVSTAVTLSTRKAWFSAPRANLSSR